MASPSLLSESYHCFNNDDNDTLQSGAGNTSLIAESVKSAKKHLKQKDSSFITIFHAKSSTSSKFEDSMTLTSSRTLSTAESSSDDNNSEEEESDDLNKPLNVSGHDILIIDKDLVKNDIPKRDGKLPEQWSSFSSDKKIDPMGKRTSSLEARKSIIRTTAPRNIPKINSATVAKDAIPRIDIVKSNSASSLQQRGLKRERDERQKRLQRLPKVVSAPKLSSSLSSYTQEQRSSLPLRSDSDQSLPSAASPLQLTGYQKIIQSLNKSGTTHFHSGNTTASIKSYQEAYRMAKSDYNSIITNTTSKNSLQYTHTIHETSTLNSLCSYYDTKRKQVTSGVLFIHTLNSLCMTYWRMDIAFENLEVCRELLDEAKDVAKVLLQDADTNEALQQQKKEIQQEKKEQNRQQHRKYELAYKKALIALSNAKVDTTLNVGIVYFMMGKYEMASSAFSLALEQQQQQQSRNKKHGYHCNASSGSDKSNENESNHHHHAAKMAVTMGLIAASHAKLCSRSPRETLSMQLDVLNLKIKAWGYNAPSISVTLLQIGHLHVSLGEYREALSAYDEALRIHLFMATTNNTTTTTATADNEATAATVMQQNHEEKDGEITAKISDNIDVGITHHYRGRVYFAINQYNKARDTYQQALKVYQNNKLNDSHVIMAALLKDKAELEVKTWRNRLSDFDRRHVPHQKDIVNKDVKERKRTRKVLRLGLR